jgi:hypothetical protein
MKDLETKAKELKRSFRKAHKYIERAQKKASRTGKDKSLLKLACYIGGLCHQEPLKRDGKRYVNPMTSGDDLYLEEIGTYKYVKFESGMFYDKDNNVVIV